MTLPIALAGGDLVGQAKTGTGKTLAFGIPLLQRVVAPGDPDHDVLVAPDRPQALVVVPTRELCLQVTADLQTAGARRGVRTMSVYGGRSYEPQVEALRRGIEVVVGTPGRLLDLARQRHLDLSHVRVLVLDEADEMLDLGFLPDVERIIAMTPENRQTMLFSATMPGQVVSLARRYLRQPTRMTAEQPDEGRTVALTTQHVFRAHAMDKVEMLARLLQAEGRGLTMVFCRTKRTASKVADDLSDRGFPAGAVHGDLGQGQREQALRAFRSGKIDVLVATDVAARGIDVEGVTHVVNYQCPEDEKTYLHRIGRTGRAGAAGIAVTFVDWDDMPRWALIDTALDLGLPEPPETYSSSPHLYAKLGVPAGATGVLPRAQRTRAGLGAEQLEDLGETGRQRGARPSGRRDDNRGGSRANSRHDESRRGDTRGGDTRGGDRRDSERPDSTGRDGDVTRPARPPRDRQRRRTRAGLRGDAPVSSSSPAGSAAPNVAQSGEQPTNDGERPAGATGRRRRRRGGAGRPAATERDASPAGQSPTG
jgi:superfamily II DNA/RNA helicase